jgi:F0F1-type ATP synthase delta subunit
MEQEYASVLVRLVESGKTPKEAVAALVAVLKRHGREALLPRVARAFERTASRAALRTQTRITVARAADAAAAQQAAGATDAHVTVDDSLIGGWRLEQNGILTDNSYKRHLLDIYHRATRA